MRFSLLLCALIAPSAYASPVEITSLSYAGSGCPGGSVSAVVAPDGSALSILYSQFVANANSAHRADAKDCTVEVKIKKPLLAALVLENADFRGFVGLESGVSAQQKVDVISGFGGRYLLNQQFAFSDFRGPLSQNYLVQSMRPLQIQGNLVDCASQIRTKTKFEFRTKVRMQSASGGQGMLTVDSADGRMLQSYRFRIVNCLSAIGGLFER